jgi:transcriptional regulator with GAF, ATPase, and Fis domain
VRELQHLVERSVILASGNTISFSLHELSLSPDHGREDQCSGSMSLADAERKHIEKVLHNTSWKVKGPDGAASILELKPSTLVSKMQKLGITRPARSK